MREDVLPQISKPMKSISPSNESNISLPAHALGKAKIVLEDIGDIFESHRFWKRFNEMAVDIPTVQNYSTIETPDFLDYMHSVLELLKEREDMEKKS